MVKISDYAQILKNDGFNLQKIIFKDFDNIRFSDSEYAEARNWYAELDDAYFKNNYSFEKLINLYRELPEKFYKNNILCIKMQSGEEKYRLKIVLNEIYKCIKKFGEFKQSRFIAKFMTEYKFFPKS